MVNGTPKKSRLNNLRKNLIVHNHGISHARGVPYYDLCEMKQSVYRAHKLYNKQLPMFDVLYMLHVIPYGDLQRQYRESNQWQQA